MGWLGSSEAAVAGLNLIGDTCSPAVPYETWKQLEGIFIEKRSHGKDSNVYTPAPRRSNAIRNRLFEMATLDARRKKSALSLLGQIELWHKPTESKVWCRDLRRSATATAPPKATIGSPSEFAVASPVTRFDTPGPDVTSATPAFPVKRPMPLAIKAAFLLFSGLQTIRAYRNAVLVELGFTPALGTLRHNDPFSSPG